MLATDKAILFAEDDPDDRFLLSESCRECGMANPCVMVEDGEEAIAYLRARRKPAPGLILLDVKMPRKTGHEALAWIRASPAWRAVPVVILSSSMHPGDIDKAYALGANAYVVKPSSVEELGELMSSLKSFWLRF
jgi:CheY-like chemotaxis protein